MKLSIYLEDDLAMQINRYAKRFGRSRNAIVREALKEWVAHHVVRSWPRIALKFTGCRNTMRFDSNRDELIPPKEDPFE